MYRDRDPLGPRISHHGFNGTAIWIGGGGVFVALAGTFVALASRSREHTAELVLVALLFGALAAWSFDSWRRQRRISLDLHERGLFYRSRHLAATLVWHEITALEARYLPGKGGVEEPRNCVTLVIVGSHEERLELPRDLEGFAGLEATLSRHSGRVINRLLLANVFSR
jgi:hypothetical protein